MVTANAYESIHVGNGRDSLAISQVVKLANALHHNAFLAESVHVVKITESSLLSTELQESIAGLLRELVPIKLVPVSGYHCLATLPFVNLARLRELRVSNFDSTKLLDLDALSAFVAGAAATIERLTVPGYISDHQEHSKERQTPLCARLKTLLASRPFKLELPSGSLWRPSGNASYYEAFVAQHAHLLENLDLWPLLYLRQKKLSDLAKGFPQLRSVLFDTRYARHPVGEDVQESFEYQQLQDLKICSSLATLSLAFFYSHTLSRDLKVLQACLFCLKNASWLPKLTNIQLIGCLSPLHKRSPIRIVESNRMLYDDFARACKQRNIRLRLSGDLVEVMEAATRS